MTHFTVFRRAIAAAILIAAVSAPVVAQAPREKFTNLQVLPKDIEPEVLRAMMAGFTRALGVRCIHCHVGQEGRPFQPGEFAKDDKPTKLKAREMIRMTQDINDKYLATLAHRTDPPIRVQCFTCHHGVTQPRMLQDVLAQAYETGGKDSTLARYRALRGRYYGSAAYDFGEVPLADVATSLMTSGHAADAETLNALNVEMNPSSSFAKRRHAYVSLASGFGAGADAGAARYRELRERYGAQMVGERMVNEVGYEFLNTGRTDAAIDVFAFNVAENPKSGNVYDSLGEAYLKKGDKKKAIAAYQEAAALDSSNTNARDQLKELGAKPKRPKK